MNVGEETFQRLSAVMSTSYLHTGVVAMLPPHRSFLIFTMLQIYAIGSEPG